MTSQSGQPDNFNISSRIRPPQGSGVPLPLAGVFDEAFDVYKRHFPVIALVVASVIVPVLLVGHLADAFWLSPLTASMSGVDNPDASKAILQFFGQLVFGSPHEGRQGLLFLFGWALASAPLAVAVSDIYMGLPITVQACFRRSRPYVLRMMSAYLCMTLSVLVAGVAAFAGAGIVVGIVVAAITALIPAAAQIASVIAAILVTVGVYFAVCGVAAWLFMFTAPVTVLEGAGTNSLCARNTQLVGRRRFWRTTGAAAALPIVTMGLEYLILWSIQSCLSTAHVTGAGQFIITSATDIFVVTVFAPYPVIFLTLLYYDYRVRREGFDVQVFSLAAAAQLGEGP